jgi:hypothetical protein
VRQNIDISFVLVKVLIKTNYVLLLIQHLLLLRNSVLQQEVMKKFESKITIQFNVIVAG